MNVHMFVKNADSLLTESGYAAINIREEGKRIFLDYFKTLIEEKQAAA